MNIEKSRFLKWLENDNDSSNVSYDDGYDSDFYGGEEDRKRLDNLPELQREEIIIERRRKWALSVN